MTCIQYIPQYCRKEKKNNVYQRHSNNIHQLHFFNVRCEIGTCFTIRGHKEIATKKLAVIVFSVCVRACVCVYVCVVCRSVLCTKLFKPEFHLNNM